MIGSLADAAGVWSMVSPVGGTNPTGKVPVGDKWLLLQRSSVIESNSSTPCGPRGSSADTNEGTEVFRETGGSVTDQGQ